MKILFVIEPRPNAGNMHAIATYSRVAAELGHTVAFYGPPQPLSRNGLYLRSALPGPQFSTDAGAFDRVVYLFESKLYRIPRLQEISLLATIPRRHRYVLDADARFNPFLVVDGYDRSHRDEAERREWLEFYDALTDQIIKPTLAASDDPRVTTLPFFGFDPALVVAPEAAPPKRYDILHVGHNWWRWKELKEQLLPAFAQIRDHVGEIGFLGLWWDEVPDWTRTLEVEAAIRIEPEAFARLRIRVEPPVPYTEVIRAMSTGRINILTQRPYLHHVKHLTLRYFEEFCADTIPLLMLGPEIVEEVYGPAAHELTLPGRVADKILDALRRPDHYRAIVQEVRRHMLAHHPYRRRVEELVAVLSKEKAVEKFDAAIAPGGASPRVSASPIGGASQCSP